jgi:hypothetical protein
MRMHTKYREEIYYTMQEFTKTLNLQGTGIMRKVDLGVIGKDYFHEFNYN